MIKSKAEPTTTSRQKKYMMIVTHMRYTYFHLTCKMYYRLGIIT